MSARGFDPRRSLILLANLPHPFPLWLRIKLNPLRCVNLPEGIVTQTATDRDRLAEKFYSARCWMRQRSLIQSQRLPRATAHALPAFLRLQAD